MRQSENLNSWLTERLIFLGCAAILSSFFLLTATAQTDDTFGDNGADPVKLFERAQSAHARGDLDKALELYQQAIKIRPEFAEAYYNRGHLHWELGDSAAAIADYSRCIERKKNFPHPYVNRCRPRGTRETRVRDDPHRSQQL